MVMGYVASVTSEAGGAGVTAGWGSAWGGAGEPRLEWAKPQLEAVLRCRELARSDLPLVGSRGGGQIRTH